jgi:N utilization substance protein A
MAKSELAIAIEQLCEEKNIPYEAVIESIEAALSVAYRKETGNKMLNVRTEFNPDDGSSRFFDVKTVKEDPPEEELAAIRAEQEQEEADAREGKRRRDDLRETAPAEGEAGAEEEERFNPKTDLGITDAKTIKPDAEIGDEIITELPIPDDFGRVAAQTAKQVIIQKLREAERETLFNQYKDRVGEIINATVHRVEGRMVYMDLGQATALMPPSEQVRNERYNIGDRYKVYLRSVERGRKGPEVIASRTAPEMVERLFDMEVPEIGSGSIEIMKVAREAGSRSKIAVRSLAENIDPIGSCVGQRGARVQTVMSELGGEKIDIIEWDEDPVKFIVNALSPAKVISVQLDEENKEAKAYVAEDQLSLAIGRGGQNVRLAAKLAGWKIDVLKDGGETEAGAEGEAETAATEAEGAPAEEAAAEAPNAEPATEEPKEEPKEEKTSDKE